MPEFSYTAKSGPHEIVHDTLSADNRMVVVRQLKARGLFPLRIDEITPQMTRRQASRLRRGEIADYTRQMADLVRSGIPLVKALTMLKMQTQNTRLKLMLDDLSNRVLKGASFSEALAAMPGIFSTFYVSMVSIGETSGHLGESLERLADFEERKRQITSQVQSALAYPAFVFFVGLATVFFMVTFFIPRISGVLTGLDQELPLLTRIVMGGSLFAQRTWWVFALLAALGGIFGRSLFKREDIRLRCDELMLRIPLVRTLVTRSEAVRFSYALGVLLRSGVPMVGALHIISLTLDNLVYRTSVAAFEAQIRKGKDLSSCLRTAQLYPEVLVNMVSVGEESGELGDMLLRAARIFESQVNRMIKTALSLLEPLLIVVIGGLVMIIVFALLFPVFQMNFMIQ